jgi:peptidoglycan/xylan/chitin deacetylase (PgdA/CDA1 family)
MQRPVSVIWQRLPSDLAARTASCVKAACEQASGSGEVFIFFRADDIAAPGSRFARLLEVFSFHRAPLCLAVVPAWLTPARWQAIEGIGKKSARLWCWHQHGWRHVNHELAGKKQEFGPRRTPDALARDIRRGRQRLRDLMGKNFYPVFTPPWNRCGQEALEVLKNTGYLAVSRSRGCRPPAPPGLPSFDVNVDLHTRKEGAPQAGWNNFFNELHLAISSGGCGIMIHHQRMNTAAFDFLDILLKALKAQNKVQLVHFKELLYTAQ